MTARCSSWAKGPPVFVPVPQPRPCLTGSISTGRRCRPLLPAGSPGGQTADRAALWQLEALARPGDALLTFLPDTAQTAMGPVLALAQETGLSCITLCGRPVAGLSLPGLVIDVPDASGAPASLVHELLFAAGHLVCRLVDYYLFENVTAIQTVDPQ